MAWVNVLLDDRLENVCVNQADISLSCSVRCIIGSQVPRSSQPSLGSKFGSDRRRTTASPSGIRAASLERLSERADFCHADSKEVFCAVPESGRAEWV